MTKLIKLILALFLLSQNNFAQDDFSISLGRLTIGEKRLDLDLTKLQTTREFNNKNIEIKTLRSSVQWVREAGNLLTPKAMVAININSKESVSIKYDNQIIIPQGESTKSSFIYIDLYSPKKIEIYENENLIENISFSLKLKAENKLGHLIDYSCAKYKIEISGLDEEYLSIGCTAERLGEMGREKNRIILSIKVNAHHFFPHSKQNLYSILMNNKPLVFNLNDENKKNIPVTIKANFPSRAHRLHLALGLGPYTLNIKDADTRYKYDTSFAGMLYGRWDLTESSSLRIFEALVYRGSLFSNTGLYFAYDLASAFDNKIRIVPLLGAQILTFRKDKNSNVTNNVIYPQGFEATFNHAFGFKNFNFTYGMFLSTQTAETYKNLWIRWGKGVFWELNYIKWGHADKSAEMTGFSIGIPIGKLF